MPSTSVSHRLMVKLRTKSCELAQTHTTRDDVSEIENFAISNFIFHFPSIFHLRVSSGKLSAAVPIAWIEFLLASSTILATFVEGTVGQESWFRRVSFRGNRGPTWREWRRLRRCFGKNRAGPPAGHSRHERRRKKGEIPRVSCRNTPFAGAQRSREIRVVPAIRSYRTSDWSHRR